MMLIAAAAVKVSDESAQGASTTRLSLLAFHGDQFWNYDFTARRVRADGVDWPMSLVFYGNATINKVKRFLGNEYDKSGSPMYARLKDGRRWQWDRIAGPQDDVVPGTQDPATVGASLPHLRRSRRSPLQRGLGLLRHRHDSLRPSGVRDRQEVRLVREL